MAGVFSKLVSEMQRRKVFRVTTAYAVVAFIVLQLGEITFDPLALPEWSLRALIVAVLLGFPLVVLLSWMLEITPDGIRREVQGNASKRISAILVVAVLVVEGGLAVYLYRVYAPGIMSDPAPAQLTAPLPATETPAANSDSIAVLPFDDLSPESDQRYFVDGVAEELRYVLSRVDGLKVASKTSVAALRDQQRSPQEIGGFLNVGWVLEGSVRKEGEAIRVRVELIDTAQGLVQWSETFDGDLENTLTLQDDIANSIVSQMLGSAEGLSSVMASYTPIANFDAWSAYLEAREYWRRRTPEALGRAQALFSETIAQDPTYAKAYAGLADTYLLQASYGNRSILDAVRHGQEQVDIALRLDGQSSEAFASLGLLNWMLGRHVQAENFLRRAMRLDEENMNAANWLAGLLGSQGRLGEERVVLTEALEKVRFDQMLNINLANNDLRRGDYDAGMDRLGHLLEIFPDSTLLLRNLAGWQASYGQHTHAHTLLKRAESLSPDEPTTLVMQGHLYLRWGALQQAEQVISRALEMAPHNEEVEMSYARLLLNSGRMDDLVAYASGKLERMSPDEVTLTTNSLHPYLWLGQVSLQRGDYRQASEYFQAVLDRRDTVKPGFALESLTLSVPAAEGLNDPAQAEAALAEASRIFERLRVQGDRSPGMDYAEAALAALHGESETALALLEKSITTGWVSARELERDARLSPISSQPRFVALVDGLRARSDTEFDAVSQQLTLATARTVTVQYQP